MVKGETECAKKTVTHTIVKSNPQKCEIKPVKVVREEYRPVMTARHCGYEKREEWGYTDGEIYGDGTY